MFLRQIIHSLSVKIYSIEHVRLGNWWDYSNVNSPFTRMYYVKSSNETYVEHGEKRYPLKKGHMYVIPPFTAVNYFCGDYCEHYGVMFQAPLAPGLELFTLPEMSWEQQADHFIPQLFERLIELNPGREIKIADPFHKSYNESIRELNKIEQSVNSILETESIIKLLISRFIKDIQPINTESSQLSRDRILKILTYIDDNLDQPMSLDSLAKIVHLNPTYLSNLFTEIIKIRPTAYIKNKRIEKAQLLLISTDRPLKQISAEVGIENPDYFFRVFKNHVGCTPTEYRNKHS